MLRLLMAAAVVGLGACAQTPRVAPSPSPATVQSAPEAHRQRGPTTERPEAARQAADSDGQAERDRRTAMVRRNQTARLARIALDAPADFPAALRREAEANVAAASDTRPSAKRGAQAAWEAAVHAEEDRLRRLAERERELLRASREADALIARSAQAEAICTARAGLAGVGISGQGLSLAGAAPGRIQAGTAAERMKAECLDTFRRTGVLPSY